MIRSFKSKETERIWLGRSSRRPPRDIQDRAPRKLRQLDAALTVDDPRHPPGHHLEALGGERKGRMSIRIDARWRLCFAWNEGEAGDVEIVDYH